MPYLHFAILQFKMKNKFCCFHFYFWCIYLVTPEGCSQVVAPRRVLPRSVQKGAVRGPVKDRKENTGITFMLLKGFWISCKVRYIVYLCFWLGHFHGLINFLNHSLFRSFFRGSALISFSIGILSSYLTSIV